MKKIYISLGIAVSIFTLSIYFTLFKENKISDDKLSASKTETFPKAANIIQVESHLDKQALSTLELQVQSLTQQIDSLSKKLLEPNQQNIEASFEKNVANVEDALSDTETLTDEIVFNQHEEQKAVLTARLMQESVDTDWAEETMSAIETAIETNEELAGIDLIQTTCMSTLCKLEINIDQNASAEEIMQKLSTHRTWNGATTFAVNSAGYAEIIFAREGHSLTNAEHQ